MIADLSIDRSINLNNNLNNNRFNHKHCHVFCHYVVVKKKSEKSEDQQSIGIMASNEYNYA